MAADLTVKIDRLSETQLDFINRYDTVKRMIMRVYRKSQSEKTAETYTITLMEFFKWLKEEPDQAIAKQRDWAEVINDYIDQLVALKLAPNTIRCRTNPVRKWLKVNSVTMDSEKIEVPKMWRVEPERIPTKAELREILKGSNVNEKLMVTMLVSGGFRIGSLLRLRLKDVDLNAKYPAVMVRSEIAKGRIGYMAFISEEAKGFLKLSLKERELNGEKITPDSFLICTSRPQGAPISVNGAESRWNVLLEKSGLAKKDRRWNDIRVHTLRKYFKSWASLSGVDSDLVEALMGHRSTISQRYFLTNIEQGLNSELMQKAMEEYSKAVPALTIFDGDEKVKDLEKKVEQQKAQLEQRELRWETRFNAMSEQIKAMREQIASRVK